MRMSIRITFGPKRAALSTASSPLLASPTTSMSGSSARSMRKPARTIDWSSTTSTRISIVTSPSGRRVAEHEAAPVRDAGAHLAAVDLHALADADEPVAEAVARRAAEAVVADLELQRVRLVAHGHVGPGRARVLERVRQALLDDAVGGELDRPRQRGRVRLRRAARPGRPARPTSSSSESRPSSPGWGTSSASSPSRAHRPEQAAHLGERGAAGALDALERLAVLRRARRGACAGPRPTWSTITLTEWATMSWSSRAMRARSSATARRAAASRSRSAAAARSLGRLGLLRPLAHARSRRARRSRTRAG